MTLGFTLISLYVPIKGLISEKLYVCRFLSYLELRSIQQLLLRYLLQ
jgi:hypothetical protein